MPFGHRTGPRRGPRLDHVKFFLWSKHAFPCADASLVLYSSQRSPWPRRADPPWLHLEFGTDARRHAKPFTGKSAETDSREALYVSRFQK